MKNGPPETNETILPTIEEWGNQMQHIILLFWLNNFEISLHKKKKKNLVLFTVDFFPSCGWNNWSLEEWTSATELFKLFLC